MCSLPVLMLSELLSGRSGGNTVTTSLKRCQGVPTQSTSRKQQHKPVFQGAGHLPAAGSAATLSRNQTPGRRPARDLSRRAVLPSRGPPAARGCLGGQLGARSLGPA